MRAQARWRASMADDDEADRRSRRSADRLSDLAAYIDRLPDDDLRLVELSRVHAQHGHDALVVSDDARYLVSRFSFDSADADQQLDAFLTKFVNVLVAADRRDQLEQLGDQLHSQSVDALLDEFDEGQR